MSVSAFFPSALWLSFHIFPFSLFSHLPLSLASYLSLFVRLYFYFYSLSCNNQAQESNKWMNNNNVNGKFNELAFIKFCWYAYDHWIFIARNLVMLNWGCQHLWTTISVKYICTFVMHVRERAAVRAVQKHKKMSEQPKARSMAFCQIDGQTKPKHKIIKSNK